MIKEKHTRVCLSKNNKQILQMKSIIGETIKENFYIKLYFDTSEGMELAGIKQNKYFQSNEVDTFRVYCPSFFI